MPILNLAPALAAAESHIAYMLEADYAASWEQQANAIERARGLSLPNETRRVVIARLAESIWDEWPGFYEMAVDDTLENIAIDAETARNLGIQPRTAEDDGHAMGLSFLPMCHDAVPTSFVDTMHALRAAIHDPQTLGVKARVQANIGDPRRGLALSILDLALEFLTPECSLLWEEGFSSALEACMDLAALFNRGRTDPHATLMAMREAAHRLEGIGRKADKHFLYLTRVALPSPVTEMAPALYELLTHPPHERVAREIARRFGFVPWDPADLPEGVKLHSLGYLYDEGVKHPVSGETIRWMDHPVGKAGAEILPGAIPLLSATDEFPGSIEDHILDDGYLAACCDYDDGYQALLLVINTLRYNELPPHKVRASFAAAHEHLRRPRPPTPVGRVPLHKQPTPNPEKWSFWKTLELRRHHDGERYLARVIELMREKPGTSMTACHEQIAVEETTRRADAYERALEAYRDARRQRKGRRRTRPTPPGTITTDDIRTAILRFRKIFETS